MPIYNYQCNNCGKQYEIYFRSVDDSKKKHLYKCPYCNSYDVEKIPSDITIRFKGSGFYETDYKYKKND